MGAAPLKGLVYVRDSHRHDESSQLLNGCCISQSGRTCHSCLEERERRDLSDCCVFSPWGSFVMVVRALNWSSGWNESCFSEGWTTLDVLGPVLSQQLFFIWCWRPPTLWICASCGDRKMEKHFKLRYLHNTLLFHSGNQRSYETVFFSKTLNSGKQAVLIAYFLQVKMDGLHVIKTGTIIFDSLLNVSILNGNGFVCWPLKHFKLWFFLYERNYSNYSLVFF